MMFHPINHDTMRNENIMTVLRCIQEEGPIVRRDIKERTGLSWGSVSTIVNMLLERGLVIEKKISDANVKGRNPSGLDIATDGFCIVGIDINRSGLTAVTIDLKCNVIHSIYQKIEIKEYEAVIRQIYELLDTVTEKAKTENRTLLGIGISMQGSVDGKQGISRFSPYFENWKNVPLAKMVRERYDCSVVLEHSPECSAIYEIWFGMARNSDNFLYVRLGHSVGVSIIVDGNIVRGYDGNAGELGHTIVVHENGELCRCGNRGCLETVASEASVIHSIIGDIIAGKQSYIADIMQDTDLENMTMEHVYRAYCEGDELCKQHIDRMIKYLSISLSNLINLLNPKLIVLGGDMVRFEGMFIQQLRSSVQKLAWGSSRKAIVTSTSKDNTAALGATLLVMRSFFSGDEYSTFFD